MIFFISKRNWIHYRKNEKKKSGSGIIVFSFLSIIYRCDFFKMQSYESKYFYIWPFILLSFGNPIFYHSFVT
jgi:hypothetical protein